MTRPPAAPAPTPARGADWLAIGSLVTALLAALTCTPLLTALAGVGGFVCLRRARRNATSVTLPIAALAATGLALALQLTASMLATRWLGPSMQRRTVAALTATLAGDWPQAVPEPAVLLDFAAPLPAPSREGMERFSASVRTSLGDLRSIAVVNETVEGSPLSPTISMPLVLEFERGSASGWSRVQWIPGSDPNASEWLPAVRVLAMEVTLPDGSTARLGPDAAEAAKK